MSDTGWFGKAGTAKLATQQQNTAGGISAVTRTMIAAYKQFDDVDMLLQLLDSDVEHFDPQQRAAYDKIRERHEKYRVAQAQEVLP